MLSGRWPRMRTLLTLTVLLNLASCSAPQRVAQGPTKDDLTHGQRQLRSMLRDRPNMAVFISEQGKSVDFDQCSDEIRRWTVRQFAGQHVGARVHWNKEDLSSKYGLLGASLHPSPLGPGWIAVFPRFPVNMGPGRRQGEPVPFELLWSVAIYELVNIRNGNEREALQQKAMAGAMSKRDFVLAVARAEHNSALQQLEFYEGTWLPWARRNGLKSDPSYWRVGMPRDYEKCFLPLKTTKYPWIPYAAQYDELVEIGEARKAKAKAGKGSDVTSPPDSGP